MAIAAIPINPVQSTSGNQFRATRIIEDAAQTYAQGTPIMINTANGAIKVWDGTAGAGHLISGISYEFAHNYASAGLGAPLAFQPIVGLGATITFGTVPNQSAAVNIPMGAPFTDGRAGFFLPTPDTTFSGTFGNAGSPAVPAATDVGVIYGLTLDTLGHYWYVDKSKTGASGVLTVVGIDPRYNTPPVAGANVLFTFNAADVSIVSGP